MEQITKQTIIDAVIALDISKLKQTLSDLSNKRHGACEAKNTRTKIIGTLAAAGLGDCPEVEKIASEVEEIDKHLSEFCELYEYCYKAIKNLE